MYFGCHNHTEYSNITTGLDSINKLEDLVNKAKEFGMRGIAITNHDNLSEVIEINRMQKKLRDAGDNFVLAIGNEIYLVDSYDPDDKQREKYYHFLLIAKDKIGYQALIELSTRAWYRSTVKWGKRRVPTLKSDIEEVMEWARGHVVASTACLGGEFPTLINNGEYDKAEQFLEWCNNQFGNEDFYIELQPSDSKDQTLFNQRAVDFYNGRAQFIITTDAHYQNVEDFPVFEAFLRSKQEDREVKEYYTFARMMDEREIYELMCKMDIRPQFVNKCFLNTLHIADQIEFYDLAQDPRIPKVELPPINVGFSAEQVEDLAHYPTLWWATHEKTIRLIIVQCIALKV